MKDLSLAYQAERAEAMEEYDNDPAPLPDRHKPRRSRRRRCAMLSFPTSAGLLCHSRNAYHIIGFLHGPCRSSFTNYGFPADDDTESNDENKEQSPRKTVRRASLQHMEAVMAAGTEVRLGKWLVMSAPKAMSCSHTVTLHVARTTPCPMQMEEDGGLFGFDFLPSRRASLLAAPQTASGQITILVSAASSSSATSRASFSSYVGPVDRRQSMEPIMANPPPVSVQFNDVGDDRAGSGTPPP